ncbi:MAG: hypothetical protein RL026_443 [Pseudomonadota bacterium]
MAHEEHGAADLLPAGFPQRILALASGLDPARAQLLSRVAELGLPGLRDDHWRHANLRRMGRSALHPAALTQPGPDRGTLALPPALPGLQRLVMVDGRPCQPLSDAGAWAMLGEDHSPLDDDATLQGGEQRFALLCEALAPCRPTLRLPDGAALEILHLLRTTADPGSCYPLLHVQVAAGAKAQLVERHLGGTGPQAFCASLLKLAVAQDATLVMLRLNGADEDSHALHHLRAQIAEAGVLELTCVDVGGAAVHHGVDVLLEGRGAGVGINLLMLGHAQRNVDARLDVRHGVPDTTSRQCVRAIANDRSTLSATSRVEVLGSAPGSQSRQSLKGLLGDRHASINLRPQLEILTDDVQASHGATTGALDENMLFYLLSRGIDAATARQLLEWAFASDVLAQIEPAPLRREVERDALARLDNTAAREASA